MIDCNKLVKAARSYVAARQHQWDHYNEYGRIPERLIKKEEKAFLELQEAVKDR